jgi:IS5 family transposase
MHCNPDVRIVHQGKSKRLSAQERELLERRQAIEPIIGHLKADHRMDRCHLKGETGDRLHAVLCAAGYNIRWLLRIIAKKDLRALLVLLLRLLRLAKAGAISLRPGMMHAQPSRMNISDTTNSRERRAESPRKPPKLSCALTSRCAVSTCL